MFTRSLRRLDHQIVPFGSQHREPMECLARQERSKLLSYPYSSDKTFDALVLPFLKQGAQGSYVVEENGKPQGFVVFQVTGEVNHKVGKLVYLAVDPLGRNKGFGQKLTQFAVERMEEDGVGRTHVQVTDLGLEPFYQRQGFHHRVAGGRNFAELVRLKEGMPLVQRVALLAGARWQAYRPVFRTAAEVYLPMFLAYGVYCYGSEKVE